MDPVSPINLGTHTAGEKFTYTIKITNSGKSPLTIRDVVPKCTCVKARLNQKVIQPGETVELILTIDTVNQSRGEMAKYVTLYTNDPNRQEAIIKLNIKIT
jgi:uncharacterized membrane protein